MCDNMSEVNTKKASYKTVHIHRHTYTQNNVKKKNLSNTQKKPER